MKFDIVEEPVQLTSNGATLVGRLFLPAPALTESPANPPASVQYPAAILCHGAIEYKEHFFPLARHLAEQGMVALALDMHGHGESGGHRYHVEMKDWVADVRAAWHFLTDHPQVNGARIGGFGFSSGGTAVLEAAIQEVPLKALVTLDATVRTVLKVWERPFFAICTFIGRQLRRWAGHDLRLPLGFALKSATVACNDAVNRYVLTDSYLQQGYAAYPVPGAMQSLVIDTLTRVDRIRCPVCVIHGAQDRIDPPATARKLFSRLRAEKSLTLLPQSGHMGHLDNDRDQFMNLTFSWFHHHL